jgi:hemoglobin
MTPWEAIGAEPGARLLVARFVDRMLADPIIGFRFAGVDRDNLVERELEHASRVLGGPLKYRGRPLAQVHGPLRINAGQFRRRLALLKTVARELGVPDAPIDGWIAHDRALEPVLTDGTDCLP